MLITDTIVTLKYRYDVIKCSSQLEGNATSRQTKFHIHKEIAENDGFSDEYLTTSEHSQVILEIFYIVFYDIF